MEILFWIIIISISLYFAKFLVKYLKLIKKSLKKKYAPSVEDIMADIKQNTWYNVSNTKFFIKSPYNFLRPFLRGYCHLDSLKKIEENRQKESVTARWGTDKTGYFYESKWCKETSMIPVTEVIQIYGVDNLDLSWSYTLPHWASNIWYEKGGLEKQLLHIRFGSDEPLEAFIRYFYSKYRKYPTFLELIGKTKNKENDIYEIPSEYVLHPVYPSWDKPFKSIKFGLPEDSEISLNVYDMEGREVIDLIHGVKEAGNYYISWNMLGYPSGEYLVKFNAGKFSQTKKTKLKSNLKNTISY